MNWADRGNRQWNSEYGIFKKYGSRNRFTEGLRDIVKFDAIPYNGQPYYESASNCWKKQDKEDDEKLILMYVCEYCQTKRNRSYFPTLRLARNDHYINGKICWDCFDRWKIDMTQFKETGTEINFKNFTADDHNMFIQMEINIRNLIKMRKEQEIQRRDLLEKKFTEARILTNLVLEYAGPPSYEDAIKINQ